MKMSPTTLKNVIQTLIFVMEMAKYLFFAITGFTALISGIFIVNVYGIFTTSSADALSAMTMGEWQTSLIEMWELSIEVMSQVAIALLVYMLVRIAINLTQVMYRHKNMTFTGGKEVSETETETRKSNNANSL